MARRSGARCVAAAAVLAAAAPAVAEATSSRLGSFMVLGDWGWDARDHGDVVDQNCQLAIANLMNQTFHELGDVKFVINVGDSFYHNGVASKEDPQWDTKWRKVYSEELRSVPWLSVYGNHDTHQDPCTCDQTAECAQVNRDIRNLDYFYMPDVSWFLELPELNTEVIAMDLNHLWANYTCEWTACPERCPEYLKSRADAAFDLFYRRSAASTARNLLVFSHYPTDYFKEYPNFIQELSRADNRHIEYFGGHRHNVDQTTTLSIAPNNNWLVGGGGGWSCDGKQQGFVVGEIPADGGPTVTRAVLVDPAMCCPSAGPLSEQLRFA